MYSISTRQKKSSWIIYYCNVRWLVPYGTSFLLSLGKDGFYRAISSPWFMNGVNPQLDFPLIGRRCFRVKFLLWFVGAFGRSVMLEFFMTSLWICWSCWIRLSLYCIVWCLTCLCSLMFLLLIGCLVGTPWFSLDPFFKGTYFSCIFPFNIFPYWSQKINLHMDTLSATGWPEVIFHNLDEGHKIYVK